jgi:hypothetical protein
MTDGFQVGRGRVEIGTDEVVVATPLRRRKRLGLSDLTYFALVPLSRPFAGFDVEFILSWKDRNRQRVVRLAAYSESPDVKAVVAKLQLVRPDASILDVSADEVLDRMGVLSGEKLGALWGIGAVGLILAGAARSLSWDMNLLGQMLCPAFALIVTAFGVYFVKRRMRSG